MGRQQVLFKTTDGAATWTNVTGAITSNLVWALAVDPSDSSTVYAGLSGFGALYKSIDAAASWHRSSKGIKPSEGVPALAIDPSDPSTLYAGTVFGTGLLKSTDAGANWVQINTGITASKDISDLALDPAKPSVLYVAASEVVYKSADGGAHWKVVLTGGDGSWPKLALDPLHQGAAYVALALIFADVFVPTVQKTTDGGVTWVPATAGLSGDPVFGLALPDPADPAQIAALGVDTFQTSPDGGQHWKAHPGGYAGVFGPLVVDPSDPKTLYASGDGVIKSINGGRSWRPANNGLGGFVFGLALDPSSPSRLYVASGGVYVTTDGAQSWKRTPLPDLPTNAIAVDPVTPDIVYTGTIGTESTSAKLFRSLDRGRTWSEVLSLPTNWAVFTIEGDPVDADTVYVGAEDQSAGLGYVEKTTDGGKTWHQARVAAGGVNSLAIDPSDPSTIYVGSLISIIGRGGVSVSTDAGAHWSLMNEGGLTSTSIDDLLIDPTCTRLWASTVGGVFEFKPRP